MHLDGVLENLASQLIGKLITVLALPLFYWQLDMF